MSYAADGEIDPILAMWPSWKATHERYDKNYREDDNEHNVFATALTIAAHCLSASILADSATRGFAISFFTLASIDWLDCFLALLLDIGRRCHRS